MYPDYWDIFAQSGKVEDYLSYRAHLHNGETSCDHQNQGDRTEAQYFDSRGQIPYGPH